MDQSHPPSYDEATHPSFICASQYLQTRLFTPLFRIISISTPSIDDLPFDQSLENYEVMQSDWYTFVNCLVDLEGPPYRQRMVHFWNQRFFNPRRLEIELCADSGSTPQRHIAVGCGYQDFTSRAHTKSQTDILRHQNLWRLAFTYCKTALSRNALSRILSKKKNLSKSISLVPASTDLVLKRLRLCRCGHGPP